MTTLEQVAQRRAEVSSQATVIEQSRAVAEVAAAVRVAQDNPRNEARSVERMRQACTQKSLADRAFFSVPRAGGRIEGPSVHLARELARCWGNVDYGIRELRRDDTNGQSEMQAWAWDQESNVRSTRSFIVPHAIMAGKGADKRRKALMDLAEIANNNNSVAARQVRETIFTILPVWFRDEAENTAAHTLQNGDDGKTVTQQAADMVKLYADTFNVTAAQVEEHLGRPRSEWTAQDLGYLRVLGGEMNRGEKHADMEFPTAAAKTAAKVTADEIAGGGPDA